MYIYVYIYTYIYTYCRFILCKCTYIYFQNNIFGATLLVFKALSKTKDGNHSFHALRKTQDPFFG